MAARVPSEVTVTYERRRVRCGKGRCRCNTADQRAWHGPYWYGFYLDPRTGKLRSTYVGKHFVPPTETRRVHTERRAPPTREDRNRGARREREAPRSPPRPQDERDAERLGVSVNATREEARRAWRKLLAANHPDKYPEGKQRKHQEEIAKQINAAWMRFAGRRGWL